VDWGAFDPGELPRLFTKGLDEMSRTLTMHANGVYPPLNCDGGVLPDPELVCFVMEVYTPSASTIAMSHTSCIDEMANTGSNGFAVSRPAHTLR